MSWLLVAIFLLAALATALLLNLQAPLDPVEARLQELARRRQGVGAGPGASPGLGVPPGRGDLAGPPGSSGGAGPAPGRAGAAIGARGREALRRLAAGLASRLQGGEAARRLQERLRRAGLRLLPAEFFLFQVASAGLAVALGVLALGGAGWLLAPAGFAAPSLWLARREQQRLRLLDQQLPDAMLMMANSLRSGFSLLQAMEVVSREMPDPIARELAQVLREHQVGVPLEDALQAMAARCGSADLDLMVTAVLIQRKVGGNLAGVLEKIAGTIRSRLHLLGQVRALTAQGRLSGLIIGVLPLAMGVALYLLAPGFLDPLLHHPLGWGLLALGALMQATGLWLIRRLVDLEV